ncbi:hypothetical protein N6H18_08410 [Reichenbachiella agarivorans]|uniref:Uncharacterized protein n=1 Tax=Reichenbachiella agarivorans TaxID=2979464 RepID=A0ABY6CTW8_9BACT|nr:hypothetical protein [Reichenbachiella agarivorans]UXP33966.1 hypothetical protein N6H18_08410 [Reichenbachiella agarivorans]
MNKPFETFVDYWHQIAMVWSQIALACAGLLFFYYLLLLTTRKSPTDKYEFIITHEIKYFWYTALALCISITFFINSLMISTHSTTSDFVLIAKTFVSLIIGFAIGYTINQYLTVFYPSKMEKKLHDIRFQKRLSPTGNEMRLLTEHEEDLHLTEEMIHHEHISAYEYDVWIDDESGYKKIEKYKGNIHLLICENCNFRTLKEINESIIAEPTDTQSGKLRKHYECSYCGHYQEKEKNIAPLSSN